MKDSENKSSEKKTAEKAAGKKKETSKQKNKKDLPYNPEVTKEDEEALQHENLHTDGKEDEELRERKEKVDFTGRDLDIPGRRTAKKSGRKGMTDEENQLFSQGGPDKENLEEDDSAL